MQFILLFGFIWLIWFVFFRPRKRPGPAFTDVRSVEKDLPASRRYNPERYFRLKKGIFIGLDQQGKPIYVNKERYRKTHTQLLGITGSGKGVAASVLLAQSAIDGEAVFVFDPKDDEFMPRVLGRIAKNNRIPFHLIDLRPDAPPQFNIFNGASEHEIEEMLVAGFDLSEKGDIADVYRLEDRKAAALLAQIAVNSSAQRPRHLMELARQDKEIVRAKKFWAELEELSGLDCIDAESGFDLSKVLSEGGIVYLLGSTRYNRTVKLQKMVLLRIMQLIERRDRSNTPRYAVLFLDELKYLLSSEALRALGTVRDKYAHVILAHQSLGDLRDCGNLNPQAVEGALDNTGLKLVYRVNAPLTAQWASRLTGQVRAYRDNVSASRFKDGSWSEAQRPLFDENMFLRLPDMTGVLIGDGLAKSVNVSPLPADNERPMPVAIRTVVDSI